MQNEAMHWRMEEGTLIGSSALGEMTLLTGAPATVTTLPDPHGVGVFLQATAEKPSATLVLPLGDLAGIARFTACYRYEPFWMTPKAGTRGGDVPEETQYLLAERPDGSVVLFVPLVCHSFRCSLEGTGEDGLALRAESGDEAIVTDRVVGLFVAAGSEPFALLKAAARSVADYLQTGRLREDKPLPDFVDQFGWCTWDAFYQDVSHDKVRDGLESFARGDITPRLLILDDGWQSEKRFPTRERRLTSFAANEKFPGDLAPTVRMAKDEFGIDTFLVWHAVSGYWGGVDGDALPGYGVRSVTREYNPAMKKAAPLLGEWFGYVCGTVDTANIYRFYQDYHRHLRKQGVDGVKVDNQASLEALSHSGGYGGRAGIMQAYHEALEGSVQTQFRGNLINCMSCANDMFYSLLNSTITRTSTDFWPNKPESHGLHLYCNAQVSAWFGQFAHPDWDMFQSGHAMGAYHAAGRAVSGSPVYVSDKPDSHNFDVLRKLVLPDGSVLRCEEPGRPTRDCLFHDPTQENVLLKIWNRVGIEGAGIVGVFHARYGEGIGAIAGAVRPSDVAGIEGERFAVYAHYAGELRILAKDDEWPITLEPLTAEVFTVVPVADGFAGVGIAEMFNSHGAIFDLLRAEDGRQIIDLRVGGTFVAYSERQPAQVMLNVDEIPFDYDTATGRLSVTIPNQEEPIVLFVSF